MLVFANRKDILINDQWHFRFNYEVQRNSGRLVNLPHTWNALDADVKPDYHRGLEIILKRYLFLRSGKVNVCICVLKEQIQ